VLGGYGATGRALVSLLLRETQAHLVVAGRNAARARDMASELNARAGTDRVAGVGADAADPASLRNALAGAHLVVVATSSAAHAGTVARTALEMGLDYLDLQYSPRKLPVLRALADEIEAAGRCFITDAGFHPGLPAVLVRGAAARFDWLERAIVASVINPRGGIPYTESVNELVESFRTYRALVYRDGAWQQLRSWNPYRRIRFGAGFGVRACVPLPLEEMLAIPQMFRGLRETGFYIAGFNWFADWIVSPVVMAGVWLFPRRAVRPMGRLLCLATRVASSPPHGVVLQVRAEGLLDGRPGSAEMVLFHEDGYVFTAAPVVGCLLQMMDGTARRPGLHLMGHVVDPARLMTDLRRMGVRIEESTRRAPATSEGTEMRAPQC